MTLRALIIEARRAYLYLDRGPSRLHTDHTSLIEDVHDADEGGLGPPFTADMHRYLQSHQDAIRSEDGIEWGRPRITDRPAMASIFRVAEWCLGRHTSHEGAGFAGSLCAQLVYLVVVGGKEPDQIAWHYDWSQERADRLLTGALAEANKWRRAELHRLTREAGVPPPKPEPKPWAA